MENSMQLTRSFFARETLLVARELIGKRLVKIDAQGRIAGIIVETEAYRGEEDLGCHAKAGLTNRTLVMYGLAGFSYIYFTYGKHWLFNIVTESIGYPAAVLIRGLLITEGGQIVAERRNHLPQDHWTDGPAKICQALDLSGIHNGYDLCNNGAVIFVEHAEQLPIKLIGVTTNPRIGLNNVPEPWKSMPWRFVAQI
jgi:DNA-3-methyladenine glycosylase